ncbi:MAG: hypothetical protein LUC49_03060 [Prevotella sp.]|nr:hypothetical protein [Prevotella sp.]
MNKKEYTSPSISVSKCDATFAILQDSDGAGASVPVDSSTSDPTVRGKGTDIWDEDEGDDFGW